MLGHVAVKEAVLPFDKFQGADTLLGPEMRSTGGAMGVLVMFSSCSRFYLYFGGGRGGV